MNSEKKALLRMDENRRDALINGDLAALDTCLSSDLSLVHTSGSIDSKRSLMDKLEAGALRYVAIEHLECAVDLYGEVGIQTTTSHLKVNVNEVLKDFKCRTIAVWTLQGGQWLLLKYQTTAINASMPIANPS